MRAAQKLNPDLVEDAKGGNKALDVSAKQAQELQKEVMAQGLDTLWRLGKLLLEERLRRICEVTPSSLLRSERYVVFCDLLPAHGRVASTGSTR